MAHKREEFSVLGSADLHCGTERKPKKEGENTIMSFTKDTVVVTGLDHFGDHKINASWETVKLLPALNIEEELGVKLIIHEVPVTYEYVAENIPVLWKEHTPMVFLKNSDMLNSVFVCKAADPLVVHVGVSNLATGLTLELQAHKSGYCRRDTEGKLPPRNEICGGKAEVIQPMFDVEDLCREVDKAKIGVPTICSSDAGRFLCEFIYYTSLNIDNLRTIFIHVPVLNKPYSAADLAKGIKAILCVLIQELRARSQDEYLNNKVFSVKIA